MLQAREALDNLPWARSTTDKPWRVRVLALALAISLLANTLLVARLGTTIGTTERDYDSHLTYSPADAVIKHERRVFDLGFGLNSTPYSGHPTTENNQLWTDLYNFGITRVTTDEARPMENKTLPIPNDDGHYIVSLSVFHQLHCLNRLRLAIYEGVDWTDVDDVTGITHVDHCINAVRQTITCNSDVAPLTFKRNLANGKTKEIMEVVHTCRNFDAIRDWALGRQLVRPFESTITVHDDPLGWGDYH